MSKLRLLIDPTLIFGLSTFFSVLFVEADEFSHLLRFRKFDSNTVIKHLTSPVLPLSLILAVVFFWVTWTADTSNFSNSRFRRVGWYLWNAAVIHLMDGMVGLGRLPLMESNFHILDIRFRDETFENGGPHRGEYAVTTTIVLVEIFVMLPLCYLAAIGVIKSAKWGPDIEIIICTIHILGTLIYVAPPLMNECVELAPIGERGCLRNPFSLYNFFYFWFGFGINIVWLVLPLVLLITAVQQNLEYKSFPEQRIKRD